MKENGFIRRIPESQIYNSDRMAVLAAAMYC